MHGPKKNCPPLNMSEIYTWDHSWTHSFEKQEFCSASEGAE